MPCNWSTPASFLLRNYQARFSTLARQRSYFSSSQVTLCVVPRPYSDRRLSLQLRGFRGLVTSAASAVQQPQDLATYEPDTIASSIKSTTASLSSAQISRAAAQATRLSIREGSYGDALYVVNSACQSVLHGPLDRGSSSASSLQPIQFGCAVSPRLSAHAFLHGLVRAGYTKKASRYAKLMVHAGIPIRTKSLECVIDSIVSSPTILPQLGPFARVIPRKPSLDHPSTLRLRNKGVVDRNARAALEILQAARTFGQRRTERMYRSLIETLLMQGEILVASLLFVMLLKDYEVRHLPVVTNDEPGGPNYITHDHLGVSIPSPAALLHAPFPNPMLMSRIINTMDATRDPSQGTTASQSTQSLALFAMLLDSGQIHHSRVAGLITSLYKYPRTTAHVWILQNGKPVRVEAYGYFHDVLTRLVGSLAVDGAPRPLPPLSLRSYNSLLTYALRHRLSPEMASVVLQHMCVVREPPLRPDLVTYNILLRSGTLLRKMSISEQALQELLRANSSWKLRILSGTAGPARGTPSPSQSAASKEIGMESSGNQDSLLRRGAMKHASKFVSALQRLETNALALPQGLQQSDRSLSGVDSYTLTSFISHLTATGRPMVVAETLFRVFPELAIVDHPASGTIAKQALRRFSGEKKREERGKALKRAVAYGPYVYASLINALTKAGEIGLAERVLIVGQLAERASQIQGLVPHVPPWRLTVHAYTAMMQGYAAAAHGKLPHQKIDEDYVGTALIERRERYHPPVASQSRHGYALLVHMLDEQDRQRHERKLTKPQLNRLNATLLYRSMMSGGRALLIALARNGTVSPSRSSRHAVPTNLHYVKPDARFFNAALELFAFRLEPLSSQCCSPARRSRRLRLAKSRNLAPESKPPLMLLRILRAMVAYGFDVPVGYRHLLENGDRTQYIPKRPRATHLCQPYAFPMPSRTRSLYELPAFKTRGLPIRKRVTKRTRRTVKRRAASGRSVT
ncbi:hypothetical protein BC628DRAFT_1533051 [Trametes gibbosa]|nr:hypothetical protein BC628DRAFT_1533051 [Trametes gibbosa]